MKKVTKYLVVAIMASVLVAGAVSVNAIKVDVEGVEQGTDDVTYAKNAPLADIILIRSAISNFENATVEIFDTHAGFKIMTNDELNDRTYTTDDLSTTPDGMNDAMLVYDESVPGARRITGNTGSMNAFEGDIASFTYKDAALLPDGSKGDVVITYSNIQLPLQTNFGQHRNSSAGNTVVYSRFYGCDPTYDRKLYANFKEGYSCGDLWEYDETNDRGVYKQPGIYTIGYGYWIKIWNNLLRDKRTSGDTSFTTRYGLKMDVKIQALDKDGNVVDGTIMFPITDIDVSRAGLANWAFIYNYDNENYYSETVRVNSGVDSDSKIYIPGDIEGDPVKQYKYTTVKNDGVGIDFVGTMSEPDPGTEYSGFVTVIDNSQGMNLTYWASGAQGAGINTFLLHGNEFHDIISSSGVGGTIQTTKTGNPNGDLSDGSSVYGAGTVDVADGKTVKYTMTPEKGYRALSVVVDGRDVPLPKDGESSTIELDGPDGAKMIGTLLNIGNGVYTFIFPDNNYDHSIHVEWETIDYPITYDLDGGTNSSDNPGKYTVNDHIILKEPTKEGYRFLGWKEGNEIVAGSTGAKHFTAMWEKIEPYPGDVDTPNTGNMSKLYTFALILGLIIAIDGIVYINRKKIFNK